MLINIMMSLVKKPDVARYAKGLQGLAVFLGLLSLGFALLASGVKAHDFARGFLIGLSLSLGFGSLYYRCLVRQPSRLNAHYIKVYDERYQMIQRLSAVTSLLVILVVQTLLIVLATFWQIVFSYQVFLVASFCGYVGLFCFARWFWHRVL